MRFLALNNHFYEDETYKTLLAVAEPVLGLNGSGDDGMRLVNCARKIKGYDLLPPMSRLEFRELVGERQRLAAANMPSRKVKKLKKAPKPTKERRPKRPKQAKKARLGPEFYDTQEWQRARYKAILLNDGCCECCKQRPRPGKPLHVDHIRPKYHYPELALNAENLQVLCADCNLGKGAWDQTDWRQA